MGASLYTLDFPNYDGACGVSDTDDIEIVVYTETIIGYEAYPDSAGQTEPVVNFDNIHCTEKIQRAVATITGKLSDSRWRRSSQSSTIKKIYIIRVPTSKASLSSRQNEHANEPKEQKQKRSTRLEVEQPLGPESPKHSADTLEAQHLDLESQASQPSPFCFDFLPLT